MWKEPPNFWSPVDAFFDPNNSNHNVHEIENLLSNLISCGQSINIEQDIEQEIWLWKKDYEDQGRITNILPCEDELLKKYDMRKIMKKVEIAINSLKMNSEDLEIEIEDKTCIIEICFHPDDEQTKGLVLRESEAVRRLSCLLFRIYNDKDPDSKSDKIWVSTNKPVKWSKDVRFYNPNNGGKREKHGEDKELLGEVIKCIERKNIEKIYQNMISAWKTNNIELLSKLLDFQKARASLKAEVKTMVEENLLDCMRQDIERLGLSVSVKNVDKKRKHTEKSQRENKRQKQSTSQSCSPSCSSKDELLMIDNSEGDNTETDDWTALKSTSQSCIPSCSSKDELLMFDNTAGDNTETDDWTALKSTSQSCSPSCSSKDELLMIDNSAGDNTETDDWTALKSTSQSCNLSFSSKDELLIDNSEGDNTETDDWTALKGINWNDKGMEDIDIDFWNAVLGTDRQFFKCCE